MKIRSHHAVVGFSAIVVIAVGSASAQTSTAAKRSSAPTAAMNNDPRSLTNFDYERVYDGWFADGVIDQPIFGPHDDEIGNVKNLLLNTSGEIVALIAEVGGFWDIGDTHVAIPWRDIERRDGNVYSPITVETAHNYGMFADEYFTAADVGNLDSVNEFFETGPYIWKASALLDDYVVLAGDEPFGYVSDLVFSDAGKLIAVVAAEAKGPLDGRGVYAVPWDNRDWEPRLDHYTVRHTEAELTQLPNIDYGKFETT